MSGAPPLAPLPIGTASLAAALLLGSPPETERRLRERAAMIERVGREEARTRIALQNNEISGRERSPGQRARGGGAKSLPAAVVVGSGLNASGEGPAVPPQPAIVRPHTEDLLRPAHGHLRPTRNAVAAPGPSAALSLGGAASALAGPASLAPRESASVAAPGLAAAPPVLFNLHASVGPRASPGNVFGAALPAPLIPVRGDLHEVPDDLDAEERDPKAPVLPPRLDSTKDLLAFGAARSQAEVPHLLLLPFEREQQSIPCVAATCGTACVRLGRRVVTSAARPFDCVDCPQRRCACVGVMMSRGFQEVR